MNNIIPFFQKQKTNNIIPYSISFQNSATNLNYHLSVTL